MKSIAITGTIGSGKSACSQILREAGFQVFDCDRQCHAYLELNGLLYQRVVDLLGTDILSLDGQIDRKKVAQLIFRDASLKKEYEQMFHAELRIQLKHQIEHENLFIAEVPLLFETGFDELFDEVWLIYCDEEIAVKRCMENRQMKEEEVRARIKTQMCVELKKEKSDVLFENNGTLADLKIQINEVLKGLKSDGTACETSISD
jgi:dephospho-CoA kinase